MIDCFIIEKHFTTEEQAYCYLLEREMLLKKTREFSKLVSLKKRRVLLRYESEMRPGMRIPTLTKVIVHYGRGAENDD